MEPKADKLREELVPEMLATDLAEFLVRRGVPFRETHHISGAAIKLSEDLGVPVSALTLEQLQGLHPLFDESTLTVLRDYEASVELKDSLGGTSKKQVLKQCEILTSFIEHARTSPPGFVATVEGAAAEEPPAVKKLKV